MLPLERLISEPLNTGSSIDCGSAKSLNQPAPPHMPTFLDGTWHQSVYTASCGTRRRRVLKPIFCSCAEATSAWALPGSALAPTIRISSLPSYLPDLQPAALKYLAAVAMSPFSLLAL